MKITIWSDFVCPYCYIGQAHLNKALEGFEHADDVEIEYKSYMLRPDAAHDPNKNHSETLRDKFGMSMEQINSARANLENMAKHAGVPVDYDKIKFTNTRTAHQAFQYAKEQGKGNEFFKKFYAAYFVNGELLSDPETIVRLSAEIGLDKEAILQSTKNQTYADKVNTDIEEAGQVGVRGVPFYVFNNKYALTGAQPVEQFKQVLTQVWNEGNEK